MNVAVFGASSKTGRFVVESLVARGHAVTAISRSPDRLARADPRVIRAAGDLTRPRELGPALARAECVASLAHARHTEALISALPATCERVVLTGSVRRFTRLPDPAADAVRAGEAAFLASGRRGVMLHASMVYGAPEERNVNRLLRLLRRAPAWLPVPVPLPDGGRHTVQPVFVDDMVAAVVAAIERKSADGPSIVVAGPAPITYRELVAACAAALGRRVAIVPVPLAVLAGGVRAASALGLRLPIDAAELARACEDKAFDIGDMKQRLGVVPRPFAEGQRLKLERGWL